MQLYRGYGSSVSTFAKFYLNTANNEETTLNHMRLPRYGTADFELIQTNFNNVVDSILAASIVRTHGWNPGYFVIVCHGHVPTVT